MDAGTIVASVTPAEEIANRALAGQGDLLVIPAPTRYRENVFCCVRRRKIVRYTGVQVWVPTDCLSQHLAASAIMHYLVEAKGYRALTLPVVQEWMRQYVSEEASQWALLLMRRAYAGSKPSPDGHARKWGCLWSHKCFNNAYKRLKKSPVLGMTVPLKACWRSSVFIPVLSPILVYSVQHASLVYRSGTDQTIPWKEYIKNPKSMLGRAALLLAYVLYAYAHLKAASPEPIHASVMDNSVRGFFSVKTWNAYREMLRPLWFEKAGAVYLPNEHARRYISVLAEKLKDYRIPHYWE